MGTLRGKIAKETLDCFIFFPMCFLMVCPMCSSEKFRKLGKNCRDYSIQSYDRASLKCFNNIGLLWTFLILKVDTRSDRMSLLRMLPSHLFQFA